MAEKRLKPTTFDYALAAISPVLIILMIGSLVYFLILTLYRGEFPARLTWLFGLFTMASVLITRIAIEQSRTQSFVYLALLSAATLFVAPPYFVLDGWLAPLRFPILIALLSLIVFLADRITMDTTSIDDASDAHGHGLLQSLGIFRRSIATSNTNSSRRHHNPGVWVLYFAILALPIFGLGQFFLPTPTSQRFGLACVITYLASALSLLVVISLLSLRQYVRQRDVEMSDEMPFIWLASGIGAVLGLVLLMALLPLPMMDSNRWELPFRISSKPDLTPSRWGWGKEPANSGAQQPQAQQPQAQQPQAQQPQAQQPQAQQPQAQQPQAQQPQAQQPQAQQPQAQQPQAQQPQAQQPQAQQQQIQQPPTPPPSTTSIEWNPTATFRWLLLATLLLATLFFGVKYARSLWNLLFGWMGNEPSEGTASGEGSTGETERRLTFGELSNPFQGERRNPDRVVRQMFQAAEIWGKEHRVSRKEDETPEEYLKRLGRKYSEMASPMTQLGWTYSRLAYANKSATADEAESLRALWDWMCRNRPVSASPHSATNSSGAAQAAR